MLSRATAKKIKACNISLNELVEMELAEILNIEGIKVPEIKEICHLQQVMKEAKQITIMFKEDKSNE